MKNIYVVRKAEKIWGVRLLRKLSLTLSKFVGKRGFLVIASVNEVRLQQDAFSDISTYIGILW